MTRSSLWLGGKKIDKKNDEGQKQQVGSWWMRCLEERYDNKYIIKERKKIIFDSILIITIYSWSWKESRQVTASWKY